MRGRSPPRPRRRDARRRARETTDAQHPEKGASPALKHKVDPGGAKRPRSRRGGPTKLEEKGNKDPRSARSSRRSTPSRRRSAAAASMAPRHERLHGDAERRRAALSARIETQQRREQQAHTPRMLTRGKPTKWSAKKRSDARHAHAAAIRDRLAAQRAREASQPRGCTFTPVTTSPARSASRRGAASTRLQDYIIKERRCARTA